MEKSVEVLSASIHWERLFLTSFQLERQQTTEVNEAYTGLKSTNNMGN